MEKLKSIIGIIVIYCIINLLLWGGQEINYLGASPEVLVGFAMLYVKTTLVDLCDGLAGNFFLATGRNS